MERFALHIALDRLGEDGKTERVEVTAEGLSLVRAGDGSLVLTASVPAGSSLLAVIGPRAGAWCIERVPAAGTAPGELRLDGQLFERSELRPGSLLEWCPEGGSETTEAHRVRWAVLATAASDRERPARWSFRRPRTIFGLLLVAAVCVGAMLVFRRLPPIDERAETIGASTGSVDGLVRSVRARRRYRQRLDTSRARIEAELKSAEAEGDDVERLRASLRQVLADLALFESIDVAGLASQVRVAIERARASLVAVERRVVWRQASTDLWLHRRPSARGRGDRLRPRSDRDALEFAEERLALGIVLDGGRRILTVGDWASTDREGSSRTVLPSRASGGETLEALESIRVRTITSENWVSATRARARRSSGLIELAVDAPLEGLGVAVADGDTLERQAPVWILAPQPDSFEVAARVLASPKLLGAVLSLRGRLLGIRCAIWPGTLGAPVLDRSGRLIGLLTETPGGPFRASAPLRRFAIPVGKAD